jgi:putative transposase
MAVHADRDEWRRAAVRCVAALLAAYDQSGQIEAFVDHYSHQRFHESLNNVTPSDVYFGRDKAILQQRERIKRKTLETHRLHHNTRAA